MGESSGRRWVPLAGLAGVVVALVTVAVVTGGPAGDGPGGGTGQTSASPSATTSAGGPGGSAEPSSSPATTASGDATGEPVRLAVVGDSLTGSDGDLEDGEFGPGTWLHYALGDGVEWAGGWAVPGATTADMLAQAPRVPEADVLVLLAGTNDLGLGVPFSETAENLVAIADTVGTGRVILSSVPPLGNDPGLALGFNADLAQLAEDRGWEFVDASAGLRTGDGTWREGMTVDLVHPTDRGYAVLGEALRAAITGG